MDFTPDLELVPALTLHLPWVSPALDVTLAPTAVPAVLLAAALDIDPALNVAPAVLP